MPAKKTSKKTATKRAVARKRSVEVRQTIVDDFAIIPINNETLTLTVIIGDIDQTGSSRIEIADEGLFPPQHIDGSFNKLAIEKCKKLDGKTLLLITSITDTNNNTDNNRTEVTMKLHAGEEILYVRKMQSDVKSEGDTETYIFNLKMHGF